MPYAYIVRVVHEGAKVKTRANEPTLTPAPNNTLQG